jgi:Flp pilus assembly pilin Flp
LLEYAFVVTLIAIVALLAVRFFGLELDETFSAIGASTGSLTG